MFACLVYSSEYYTVQKQNTNPIAMKKEIKAHIVDYKEIKDVINQEFAINSPEGAFVSNWLWTLPDKWIKGLADFVRENKDKSAGWVCANVLHDIGGFVKKELGFSPRCFRGGSVWDQK